MCLRKAPIHEYENVFIKFAALWDRINVKNGYSWESNPWVWVYEFERIEKPEVVLSNAKTT